MRWTYRPARAMEEATAANGKLVADWLDKNGYLDRQSSRLHPSVDRRIRAWRAGEIPRFHTLDRVITPMGVHPSELPDDVWLVRT